MKKYVCLLLALCLLFSAAMAEEEAVSCGVTILRNQLVTAETVLDYPTFACDDAAFEAFLTETITDVICQMAEVDAGQVRGGYYASTDFEGVLSVEASVHRLPEGAEEAEVELFYAIVDLNGKRMLAVEELFTEPAPVVMEAICSAVYAQALEMGLLKAEITDGGLVPAPDSYYLTRYALRVLYDTDTLSEQAVALDIGWDSLPLSWSPVLTGETSVLEPEIPAPTATPASTITPAPTVTPAPAQTLDPDFSLAPVVTPTPMPLAGTDAIRVDVLTHGLWKPLGTEGDTYYQFTADGKLLTVTVSDYTVKDGVLTSDALSGTLDIGSDSAFVLQNGSQRSGYVLNRQGERVAPEEFVTPSPTPVPTPTPTPSPVPTPVPTLTPDPTATPSPTPTATPVPTPTLSPWQIALNTAPKLEALPDAAFEKRRSLKVYSAPSQNSWSADGAQVTTDDTVAIYGMDGEWVLVSYAIGNGTKGRMGYIDDITLLNPETIPQLHFSSLPMTLARSARGTDDPLRGEGTIATLKKGAEVTLLAFFGDEWAYVETTLEGETCRLFIPVSAIREE